MKRISVGIDLAIKLMACRHGSDYIKTYPSMLGLLVQNYAKYCIYVIYWIS